MLISCKMSMSGDKNELDDETTEKFEDSEKLPEFADEDFEVCAGCKAPFKEKDAGEENDEGQQEGPRRGQQGTTDLGRRIKEFYSFNCITGELLHVTAFQALLSVFELRMVKSSPGLNFQDANANLGFCQKCGTMLSQLYKLHQEVLGLVENGSVVGKLITYEEKLVESQEPDMVLARKRRRMRSPVKANGVMLSEEDGVLEPSWAAPEDNEASRDAWNNDNDDYDMGNNDDSGPNDNDEEMEVNVKPSMATLRNNVGAKVPKMKIGKITSVGSTRSYADDNLDSETPTSSRSRRSSAKNVDYRKVLEGDDEDDDEDWHDEEHRASNTSKTRSQPKRKSAPSPASRKGRGRPQPKPPVPAPRSKTSAAHSAKPSGKKEATCSHCKKVFPASYIQEHIKHCHAPLPQPQQAPQPCLICGRYFESSYKAIKHLLTHIPEKPHGCTRCHDTFKTSEERNEHSNCHIDFDKKMGCPKCTESFQSLLMLNKHEAQKHRKTKSFLCSICAELLSGKEEWIQHILGHGPFQCQECKEYFKPGDFKKHMLTAHRSNNGPIAEVTLD